MYQSALNLKQLNLYLEGLASSELLGFQPAGKFYFTTEKGRTFARAYEHFRETKDLLREQEEALARLITTKAKKPAAVEVRPGTGPNQQHYRQPN